MAPSRLTPNRSASASKTAAACLNSGLIPASYAPPPTTIPGAHPNHASYPHRKIHPQRRSGKDRRDGQASSAEEPRDPVDHHVGFLVGNKVRRAVDALEHKRIG